MGKYRPNVTTGGSSQREVSMSMVISASAVPASRRRLRHHIDVLIWNHWIHRHSSRGSASTQEKITGARPGPSVTQNVKIDIGRPRLGYGLAAFASSAPLIHCTPHTAGDLTLDVLGWRVQVGYGTGHYCRADTARQALEPPPNEDRTDVLAPECVSMRP